MTAMPINGNPASGGDGKTESGVDIEKIYQSPQRDQLERRNAGISTKE